MGRATSKTITGQTLAPGVHVGPFGPACSMAHPQNLCLGFAVLSAVHSYVVGLSFRAREKT